MKFSIRDFLSKCDHADLVTFSEEILNGKLHFFVQCKMIGGSMNKENPEPYLEPCQTSMMEIFFEKSYYSVIRILQFLVNAYSRGL